MRASELRLENFLLLDDEKFVRVIWFRLGYVCIMELGTEYPSAIVNLNRLKPVPLTEEWLLKFGFDKKSWKSQGIVIECFYYEKNGIIIYLIARGFEIEVKHGDDQFNLFRVWNYVHQLQNLYFALCGEELELK